MRNEDIKIGITQGDMNGIGYEVILKTLMDPKITEICTPVLYGSPKAIAYHRKTLNIPDINMIRVRSGEEAQLRKINIIDCLGEDIRIELGKSTPHAGEASARVLERATEDLKSGKIHGLLTAPINKHNIQSETFNFPGHTEYFQSQFNAEEVLMLMVNNLMRVGVVAGHVPINKVSSFITIDNITKKLSIMNKSLMIDFGIRKPKIAVLGLNPHCGDNGIIGDEEQKIIIPAIEKARQSNILAMGPYAADGFFGSESYKKFDGILAMYHDQGLAPFKAIEIDSGVNYTAGLPVVRTSPAHGTAYEIAGTNQANPDSFRYAMYLAIDIIKNRLLYKEISKDPLKNVDLTAINNAPVANDHNSPKNF